MHLDHFQPFIHTTGHAGMANDMLKRYGEAVRLLRECVSYPICGGTHTIPASA